MGFPACIRDHMTSIRRGGICFPGCITGHMTGGGGLHPGWSLRTPPPLELGKWVVRILLECFRVKSCLLFQEKTTYCLVIIFDFKIVHNADIFLLQAVTRQIIK